MFGLGAMPEQLLLIDAGAHASSVVPTAAQDGLYAPATPQVQAAVPGFAPMPHQGAEPDLAPTPRHAAEPDLTPMQDRVLAPPGCTFANVLPEVGAPSEADSGGSFPAAAGPSGLGSAPAMGRSRLKAGGIAALGSAARLTISQYFAAAEGFVGEPPGGSPSTARTLSDADLATSRVDSHAWSPQSEHASSVPMVQSSTAQQPPILRVTGDAGELVLSVPTVQSRAAGQLPDSSPTGGAFHAKLAEGLEGQRSNAADSDMPAAGQCAVQKGSPDNTAAPVIFLNALPAAVAVKTGEDDGVAESAPSTRSGTPAGDDGLPQSEPLPEEATGISDAGGGLSRREQFRLAVATAEAERQKRLATLSQEESQSQRGTCACASMQPASERQSRAHDDPCSKARPGVELQHSSTVDVADKRTTASQSLDDIDSDSCSMDDEQPSIALPCHESSSVLHANEGKSSTGSHESRECEAALGEDTAECSVSTTALNATRDAANPEGSCQETHAASRASENAHRIVFGTPHETAAAAAHEVAVASETAQVDGGEGPGNALADVPVLMGDAEVLSIATLVAKDPPASSGNVPAEVPAAQEPYMTPHSSGNPASGPAEGVGLAAEASPKSISPSEQRTLFGSSTQQRQTGSTDLLHKSGISDRAPAERIELAAEASASTAPPSGQQSAFGGASQQELQLPGSAAVLGGAVDDGVEAGVVTPRRQSTQELIARFSAGANLDLPRPAPTSPLRFLRSSRGDTNPQSK